jgi:hypothetical protein
MTTKVGTCTVGELAKLVTANPAPILLVDTCSLLDIIRICTRGEAPYVERELEGAMRIQKAALLATPKVHIFIPPLVLDEWKNNYDSTENELKQAIKEVEKRLHSFKKAAIIFSSSPLNYDSISATDFIEKATQLPYDIIANSLHISRDSTCEAKAYQRVLDKEAPARKGGQIKDCAIVEHSLAFADEVRKKGVSAPIVFLTSNTKDFCESGSVKPKGRLDGDFSAMGITFVTNWAWAASKLVT